MEVGPVYRGGMEVEVGGGSYVQQLGVHGAGLPLGEPAGVGGRYEYADREYADGYVKLDAGTLNGEAVGGPGNTWNWSYEQAGQYESGAGRLRFQQTGPEGYLTTLDRGAKAREEMGAGGVDWVGGWTVKESAPWRVDLCVGFSGVWGAAADVRLTTYGELTGRVRVEDVYEVSGAVDPVNGFPGPNHRAGVVDGVNTPGPVITNVPAARVSTREDLSTAQNDIRLKVEQDVYEVYFSPRVSYAVTERWSVAVSPRLGVSYVDATVSRREVFTQTMTGGGTATLGSWRDREEVGEWSFTAGLTAGARVGFEKGWYAGVYGGYDWVMNEVELRVGPSKVALDGSGWLGGLVVGKRF